MWCYILLKEAKSFELLAKNDLPWDQDIVRLFLWYLWLMKAFQYFINLCKLWCVYFFRHTFQWPDCLDTNVEPLVHFSNSFHFFFAWKSDVKTMHLWLADLPKNTAKDCCLTLRNTVIKTFCYAFYMQKKKEDDISINNKKYLQSPKNSHASSSLLMSIMSVISYLPRLHVLQFIADTCRKHLSLIDRDNDLSFL